MPRLRRVDCTEPGIRRVRRGRGFSYVEEDGTRIDDPDTIERIAELAIPPAWTDVWVCPQPNGHLQATGFDAAERKQYLYHPHWRLRRDQEKFDSMTEFARALPALRRQVSEDLVRRGMARERILACAVRLLDLGFFRVGGEEYAQTNDTFGLATVRRRHVRIERGRILFDYRAKGSKRHVQTITDPEILPIVRTLLKRKGGGHELLAYKRGRSEWVDVKAADVNAYLKDAAGGDFSAKDFRTWNATVLAAVGVAMQAENGRPPSKTARRRLTNQVVKQVAEYLSNTPAVCRASYIDPRVFDRFDSGATIGPDLERIARGLDPGEFPERERIEKAVLGLLD